MATPIGSNTLTTVSRQYIFPSIVDTIYTTNSVFYRLNKGNKKHISGGTQFEQPFLYAKPTAGGPYQGYDLLDVSPSDTLKTGAWDLKQHYVPVTIDGRTLMKCNTPEAVVNILTFLWEQAKMQMADNLGTGLYSDGSDVNQIDGLKMTVDNGTVAATYAGLTRSSNTYLNAQRDASTATLTLASLRSMVGNCTNGGHSTSLIVSRQEQYNRLYALMVANQRHVGQDTDMTSAGFRTVVYEGIPWVIDAKVFDGANASNSSILFLNENTLSLAIISDTDFTMEDFQKSINQDAMVGKLFWAGNLICSNPSLNGIMTAVTA